MPLHFMTEDGTISSLGRLYGAKTLPTKSYRARTFRNVQESDGTIWFGSTDSAGAKATLEACELWQKPVLLITPSEVVLPSDVVQWLRQNPQIERLNIAGNRQSKNPNQFFASNNLSHLSVNSSGQQIPLTQLMGGQVVSQLSNTLGSLAQSFSTVANSTLFPNGTTSTPSSDLVTAFDTQASNALNTAAFELGSSLSTFNGFSSVISQIDPMLSGSASNLNSLASALQNLPFGGTGFDSAVTGATAAEQAG
jgi:hypothetical protein